MTAPCAHENPTIVGEQAENVADFHDRLMYHGLRTGWTALCPESLLGPAGAHVRLRA